jgi:hypothetical protein
MNTLIRNYQALAALHVVDAGSDGVDLQPHEGLMQVFQAVIAQLVHHILVDVANFGLDVAQSALGGAGHVDRCEHGFVAAAAAGLVAGLERRSICALGYPWLSISCRRSSISDASVCS